MIGRSIVFAVACIVFANQLSAQQPPPAQDSEQRFKALETKVDRLLSAVEGSPFFAPKKAGDAAKHYELIVQAKETLLGKFMQAQKEYADFRLKGQFPFSTQNATELVKRRIEKLEDALQTVRLRDADVAARITLVKNVGDSAKDARALLVLLQRQGVDFETLRRTAGANNDGPQDLVHLYGDSLRLESAECQQRIGMLEEMISREKKEARELNAYEVNEQRLRLTRDQTQKMLDAIVNQLEKIDVVRGWQNQPKP